MNPMPSRYLDVLTIRSNSVNKMADRNNKHNLLYEPVVLPNLQHLQIDKLHGEVVEDCMFYPTGESNRSMRRTMELAIRDCNNVDKPIKLPNESLALTIGKSENYASSKKGNNGKGNVRRETLKPSNIIKKEQTKLRRQPLYHVRGSDNNTLVLKNMIDKVRENEDKLINIVVTK